MTLAATVGALLVCAFGWYRAATRPTAADAFSSEQRQDLVAEMIRTSPGVIAGRSLHLESIEPISYAEMSEP